MLSFDKGIPIARVDGGIHSGRILKLDDSQNGGDNKEDKLKARKHLLNMLLKNKKKNLKPEDYIDLLEYIETDNDEDKDENPFKEYKKEIKKQEHENKEIYLNNGNLIPLPRKDKRNIYFISGPQDSGKSTFAASIAKEYMAQHPKNEVWVFSRISDDPAYKQLGRKCKKPDLEDLIDEPFEKEEMQDTLCIFDDFIKIKDVDLKKSVEQFRDMVLEEGRHYNIDVCLCNHASTNHNETKSILLQSTHYVIFPYSGTAYSYKRLLGAYLGIDSKTCEKILTLPTRWVVISKNSPRYCLYEHGAFILN